MKAARRSPASRVAVRAQARGERGLRSQEKARPPPRVWPPALISVLSEARTSAPACLGSRSDANARPYALVHVTYSAGTPPSASLAGTVVSATPGSRSVVEASGPTLAWSIRVKLLSQLRAELLEHARAEELPVVLAAAVEAVAARTACAALQGLGRGACGAPLRDAMAVWVSELPRTRRADWLVERLTHAGKISWAPEVVPADGPLPLPELERGRITARLEKLWKETRSRHGDEPDFIECANALEGEVERLSHEHEAFAMRVLTRRFSDRAGTATLTFRDRLLRQELTDPGKLVRFLEKHLEITWGAAPLTVTPTGPPRLYAPSARYTRGDRIAHPRFGDGTVTELLGERMRVQFAEGERMLALQR